MSLILANWKLAVIGALLILLGIVGRLYIGARDDLIVEKANFTNFVSRVDELGKEAEAKRLRDEADQLKNLEKVKADHEKQIPTIRARAVANYLTRVRNDASTNSGGGAVQGNGPGLRLDDGAGAQCVPDEAFIADAAEDAEKVEAWREYCRLNRCPVME